MSEKILPIYLDNQATTQMDPRVLEAMMPYLTNDFGNAHSKNHQYGWDAETGVEKARQQVADLIGANKKDIIFTSGATESNNLALKGVLEFYSASGKNHVVTTAIEHKCIVSTVDYLKNKENFEVTIVPVEPNGIVDVEKIKAAVKDNTALVSVMMVNNEVGTIQPIKEIGDFCKEKGVFFHSDAAQAVGKIEVNVDELGVDLLSISAHKLHGPKGIGALYVRRKPKRVRILPQIHGGGQERGLRSGTLPVFLCVGFGKAAEIAKAEMKDSAKKIAKLTQRLKDGLQKNLTRIYINGDENKRLYNNLNISFAGVEGESLLMGFNKNIAVSSGSACTSSSLESSYVLRAMGVEDDLAHTSIRFGLSKFTTEEEVDLVVGYVTKTVNHLREMSPIWEMLENGIDLKSIEWADH